MEYFKRAFFFLIFPFSWVLHFSEKLEKSLVIYFPFFFFFFLKSNEIRVEKFLRIQKLKLLRLGSTDSHVKPFQAHVLLLCHARAIMPQLVGRQVGNSSSTVYYELLIDKLQSAVTSVWQSQKHKKLAQTRSPEATKQPDNVFFDFRTVFHNSYYFLLRE